MSMIATCSPSMSAPATPTTAHRLPFLIILSGWSLAYERWDRTCWHRARTECQHQICADSNARRRLQWQGAPVVVRAAMTGDSSERSNPSETDEGLWSEISAGDFTDRPALFLDRDGARVHDPHYLGRAEDVRMFKGASTAVARCNRLGIPVVPVTNQSGIARRRPDCDLRNSGQRRCPGQSGRSSVTAQSPVLEPRRDSNRCVRGLDRI